MKNEIILSICIPTNGRISIIEKTLDSIYENLELDSKNFEVILSDNSSDHQLEFLLIKYCKYSNIVYAKSKNHGFLNSVNALKLGQGRFLKLHNNYTKFEKNSLHQLINFIKQNDEFKPLVFFTNNGKNDLKTFNSFDELNNELTYWNSWSTGFSIWKSDFDKISNIQFNKMFPHLSLFFNQYDKKSFVINDFHYFENQYVPNKGGYNLFQVFSVEYVNILKSALDVKIITNETFKKIKKKLLKEFLTTWYFNTILIKNKYTFQLDNIQNNIKINYGKTGYYLLLFYSYSLFFKKLLYKIFKLR
jgi:hypothetical protein